MSGHPDFDRLCRRICPPTVFTKAAYTYRVARSPMQLTRRESALGCKPRISHAASHNSRPNACLSVAEWSSKLVKRARTCRPAGAPTRSCRRLPNTGGSYPGDGAAEFPVRQARTSIRFLANGERANLLKSCPIGSLSAHVAITALALRLGGLERSRIREARGSAGCGSGDTLTLSLSRLPTRIRGSPRACSPAIASMTPVFRFAQRESKIPRERASPTIAIEWPTMAKRVATIT